MNISIPRCADLKEKENVFCNIGSIITNSGKDNYAHNINRIFSPYPIDIFGKTKQQVLNWEQIRQLNKDPLVTIGSHSVNHYVFRRLGDETLKQEILESKERIESNINGEVKHFSYPHRARDEVEGREFKIVKKCGFLTATTGRAANIFTGHKHHLESLPRISMGMDLNNERLNFLVDGVSQCIRNRFQRVVTA